jgi:arginine decarboxylase
MSTCERVTGLSSSFLANTLRAAREQEDFSFHMPGHKGGRGAHSILHSVVGSAALLADQSAIGGCELMHAARGPLADAQARAARLFGAQATHFLVNGATVGNIAALTAVLGDGDRVLMMRASHRSAYAGVILSGARPVYIDSVYDAAAGGHFGLDLDRARRALEHDRAIHAIHITRPGPHGLCFDLAPLTALARRYEVPLIVDEAYGAHFAFHPSLPTSALRAGADLVVHSAHKTLAALTQASLLHVGPRARVDAERVGTTLGMLQSSSPSALLLVSLDVACVQMADQGRDLCARAIAFADEARERINAIAGLYCYGAEMVGRAGIAAFDPTKLVIDVRGLGISGFTARAWLVANQRVRPEFCDLARIVCSITLGDTDESVRALVDALAALSASMSNLERKRDRRKGGAMSAVLEWRGPAPTMAMTPRAATQARARTIALAGAVGEVCAEFVIPQPPGIPMLVPGEVIRREDVAAIERLASNGCAIVGLADADARSLRVVA